MIGSVLLLLLIVIGVPVFFWFAKSVQLPEIVGKISWGLLALVVVITIASLLFTNSIRDSLEFISVVLYAYLSFFFAALAAIKVGMKFKSGSVRKLIQAATGIVVFIPVSLVLGYLFMLLHLPGWPN